MCHGALGPVTWPVACNLYWARHLLFFFALTCSYNTVVLMPKNVWRHTNTSFDMRGIGSEALLGLGFWICFPDMGLEKKDLRRNAVYFVTHGKHENHQFSIGNARC